MIYQKYLSGMMEKGEKKLSLGIIFPLHPFFQSSAPGTYGMSLYDRHCVWCWGCRDKEDSFTDLQEPVNSRMGVNVSNQSLSFKSHFNHVYPFHPLLKASPSLRWRPCLCSVLRVALYPHSNDQMGLSPLKTLF